MQYILRHNSSGRNAYTGKLKRKEIHNAITLHPIKQAPLMYRLHSYVQGLKAEQLRQESLLLHRDIKRMAKYLEVPDDSTYMLPSVSPAAIPDKDNGKRHFEDHNILGKLKYRNIQIEIAKFCHSPVKLQFDCNVSYLKYLSTNHCAVFYIPAVCAIID